MKQILYDITTIAGTTDKNIADLFGRLYFYLYLSSLKQIHVNIPSPSWHTRTLPDTDPPAS